MRSRQGRDWHCSWWRLVLLSLPAHAQNSDAADPVDLAVAAGGANDALARLLGSGSLTACRPVVVENWPGAGAVTGSRRSPAQPHGYTLH